jgi:hypothetical protein
MITAPWTAPKPKLDHEQVSEIEWVHIASIVPSVDNDVLYKPIHPDTPEFQEFVRGIGKTIAESGIEAIDPIILTSDSVILSGHRRRAAFQVLGIKTVPVRRLSVASTDPSHMARLAHYNRHRDKSPAERIREELAKADPKSAHVALVAQRAQRSRVKASPITLRSGCKRSRISAAKAPLLKAIKKVLDDLKNHWPLSDRRVHYALLNNPPLIHAGKPGSRYKNDNKSYRATIDLLTRGRLTGDVPFESIGDDTRPTSSWPVFGNVGQFVSEEVNNFLTSYWRDLLVGQPNHIEIVAEKLTVEGTISPVASEFTIPYTIGRGFSSLPPRKAMFDRYQASGKDKLVILFVSDHDPEGMSIPEAFAQSMRDDFGVKRIHPVRVALNPEQVARLKLPANTEAKSKSSRFHRYTSQFGLHAYELEAVPPDVLQGWLREKINQVIDVGAFNAQVEQEKQDAAELDSNRKAAIDYLKRLTTGAG